MYSDKFFNAYFYEQMFLKIFVAKRDRQGIIQEFNLGVGSHVSIILNFAAEGGQRGRGRGEGSKPPIIQLALLDCRISFLIVVYYILVCKLSG